VGVVVCIFLRESVDTCADFLVRKCELAVCLNSDRWTPDMSEQEGGSRGIFKEYKKAEIVEEKRKKRKQNYRKTKEKRKQNYEKTKE
jgi:hypothetical protein